MTERLYYTDALRLDFTARVQVCETTGTTSRVTLDRTAFYPTSGGQPFDTGQLEGAPVIEVLDGDAGDVVHVIEGVLEPGAPVRGAIDGARRLDHMQQHTGQHLLSAAFDRAFGVRTESFHLGAETSTIDLSREVTADEIARATAGANAVVWENRALRVRFVEGDEIGRLPWRKPPARSGRLRVVEVPDFDVSACGGTHVARTGGVGIIAIAGSERFRAGSRITFVCGGRALAAFGRQRDVLAAVTRRLSVGAEDVDATIERLMEERRVQTRTIRDLGAELAGYRAREWRESAETVGSVRGVIRVVPDADAAALKTLAQAVVAEPGVVAVLVGPGSPAPVVVARSADVDVDAGRTVRGLTEALGGRGGGRPELAQGGVSAAPDAVIEHARRILSQVS